MQKIHVIADNLVVQAKVQNVRPFSTPHKRQYTFKLYLTFNYKQIISRYKKKKKFQNPIVEQITLDIDQTVEIRYKQQRCNNLNNRK